LRIGHDGEAPDIGNVGGRAVHGAAGPFYARGRGIDVVHPDIPDPTGLAAGGADLRRQRHDACDHFVSGAHDRVVDIGLVERLSVPADHRAIKRLGGLYVGGHQLVPDKTVWRGRHCFSPYGDCLTM